MPGTPASGGGRKKRLFPREGGQWFWTVLQPGGGLSGTGPARAEWGEDAEVCAHGVCGRDVMAAAPPGLPRTAPLEKVILPRLAWLSG